MFSGNQIVPTTSYANGDCKMTSDGQRNARKRNRRRLASPSKDESWC